MELYEICTPEPLSFEYEGIVYYERWVTIKEFSDYCVSDFGRIKSLKSGKVLRQRKFKKGYMAIDLRLNEVRYTRYVHKLVALHFIDNPLNKPQVNHKRSIRHFNFYLGLEWVTNQENVQHGWDNGRVGWKSKRPSERFIASLKMKVTL